MNINAETLLSTLKGAPRNLYDIGNDPDVFVEAVAELRAAGHPVLVGPRHKQQDGHTVQWVSLGQEQSSKFAAAI